jgi:hypothetical protein
MESTVDPHIPAPVPSPGPKRAVRPPPRAGARTFEVPADPTGQARELLHAGFVAAPLIAGLDKFSNSLTRWEQYLDPRLARAFGARRFMRSVGVIEIASGLLVAAKPRLGGYVVAGWLGGIVGNFLVQRRYYDLALRDFGLMLGALALARLEAER